MMRPRLSSVDQMCFAVLKTLAKEEEGGFWVSGGQDVCLIIAELEEIILTLKRDYRVLPARGM